MSICRSARLASYFVPLLYGRIHSQPFGPIPGWEWNLSPGWFPATVVFLAFASLARGDRSRSSPLRFLWGVAAITAAKIWGVPVVDLLGRLPMLERVGFPRFAAFLLAFACAGLAAHGIDNLSKLDQGRWARWFLAWCATIGIVFALGAWPLWPVISTAESSSAEMLTFLTFGGLGLLWALVGPFFLWWLARRRPREGRPLCLLAALGILLQGIATATNGYLLETYALLSIGGLVAYCLAALVLGLPRRAVPIRAAIALGLLLVATPPVLAAQSWAPGLARRFDPLSRPPFLEALIALRDGNLQRSYSLDAAFQANFATPFAVSSLNVIDAIQPVESAEFLDRYLDRSANPLWFLGNLSPKRQGNVRALDEFDQNRRYFDLVGVRYLVIPGGIRIHGVTARRLQLGSNLTLRYEDPVTRVQIWENAAAAPRVFLAPTATAVASRQEALDRLPGTRSLTRHVWIEHGKDLVSAWPETEVPGVPLGFELTPNTVSIRYQANTAGILTLTDGYGQGWRASVNGREATVLRVDGTFRGVRIDTPGVHDVLFWYRPPYWTLSLALALAGVAWLCAAQWYAVRSRSA